jgi:hypothetical protein
MEKNGGKPQSETKKSRLGCAGIVIGVVLFFAALVCVLDVIMAPDEIKEATIAV